MTQRLIAAWIAVPALLALLVFASVEKLPFATYQPGGTIDVLGTADGSDAEIIQVDGHKIYDDTGQLRMTTVRVSPPAPKGEKGGMPLGELLSLWVDGDDAVYPYKTVHPDDETPESSRQEGAVQMATSQEDAVYVALTELGITVPETLRVAAVTDAMPAQGTLQVGDTLVSVNGVDVADDKELRKQIQAAPEKKPIEIGISRDGKEQTVSITPVQQEGRQLIGIELGYDYEFPFDVKINISDNIGGPSAGLIFSLAVYDTLTPGSLTGGHEIAGTGEIAADGTVGPIGGIQQKIAGARDDGAELFIVPEANCADALTAGNNGDMRLMMGRTMHEVREALEKYAADPDATLPSCADAGTDDGSGE
ncbi:PDZ domain-containing protein [soil metagenome]